MKLSELYRIVNFYHNPDKESDDLSVIVRVKMPYTTVGGTPGVSITHVVHGVDWDAGKLILIPEESLQFFDENFGDQFKALQEKCSLLDYENRSLKAEIKKLREVLNKPHGST